MRILFIYRYDHTYNVDSWLHENFMQACNEVEDIQAFVYGPRMHEIKENNCPLHYSNLHTMSTIEEIFKPDLIICNTKSRMFLDYSPHVSNKYARNCILPTGFENSKITKIMLEEDYHYETDDNWYKDMNFSLILQRHKSQSLREQNVKMRWLPFSVDLNTFNPIYQSERLNKICFAGSMSSAYPDRIIATERLKGHNLIDVFCGREKVGYKYVQCLKEYLIHLNGASAYDITAAKVFEITASGSVLFTNQFSGLQELFSQDSYVLWNESNVVDKAKELLKDIDKAKQIAYNGFKETVEKHNHSVRIKEMLQLIKENV